MQGLGDSLDKLELLSEQRKLLEGIVREQQEAKQAREQNELSERVLEALVAGELTPPMHFVTNSRPDQIEEVQDIHGMTLLHWAVRKGYTILVFNILEKRPRLADAATKPTCTPPAWTPLMLLAEMPVPSPGRDGVLYEEKMSALRQQAAVLANNMTGVTHGYNAECSGLIDTFSNWFVLFCIGKN